MKNTQNPNTNAVLSDLHAIEALVKTVDLLVRTDAGKGFESLTDDDAKLIKATRGALSAMVEILRNSQ
jgi:hypothetical protein